MVLMASQIKELMDAFERHKKRHQGVDVWSARDLMALFGYKSWQKFRNLLFRAANALEKSEVDPDNHFIQTVEMVAIGSGAQRGRENFYMTRLGAYMLTLETDTKAYEAASFAKTYFSAQTRYAEVVQERLQEVIEAEQRDFHRLDARQKLMAEEKGFQDILWTAGVDGPGIARVREAGNRALFGGHSTEDMRWKLGIGGTKRTPADFLPTPVVLAKALAASLTQKRVIEDGQRGELRIGDTHLRHNQHVRKALIESGFYPEKSEPQEDIRLVEKRMKARKKVAARMEAVPAISMGSEKVLMVRPSIQAGEHPPLFDLTE